jgi:hypothetical protein
MSPTRIVLLLLSLFAVMISSCDEGIPDFPVKYELTFTPLWTVNTHPVNYPQDAAFAPFISYSHKTGSELFTVGLIASESISILAETGQLTRMEEDIDVLRSSDRALDRARGDGVTYPRNSQVVLGFDDTHTMATVLAKISPSPDWFVAANNVQLYVNGAWVDTLSVNTIAYDAGSDMGMSFESADQPNNPASPVSIITTAPLAENGTVAPLARVSFKKIK